MALCLIQYVAALLTVSVSELLIAVVVRGDFLILPSILGHFVTTQYVWVTMQVQGIVSASIEKNSTTFMINFVQILGSAVLGGVLGGIAGFLIIVGVLMTLIIGGSVCICNKTRNKKIVKKRYAHFTG